MLTMIFLILLSVGQQAHRPDVPAFQVTLPADRPCNIPSGPFAVCITGPEKHWVCGDKSRIMLTGEDGKVHCLKFSDVQDAQFHYPKEALAMQAPYQPNDIRTEMLQESQPKCHPAVFGEICEDGTIKGRHAAPPCVTLEVSRPEPKEVVDWDLIDELCPPNEAVCDLVKKMGLPKGTKMQAPKKWKCPIGWIVEDNHNGSAWCMMPSEVKP